MIRHLRRIELVAGKVPSHMKTVLAAARGVEAADSGLDDAHLVRRKTLVLLEFNPDLTSIVLVGLVALNSALC